MACPFDRRRRRFLQLAGLASLAGCMPRPAGPEVAPLAYGAAAFDAGTDSVLIWAGHDGPMRAQVEYREPGGSSWQRGPGLALRAQNGFCAHAVLDGLAAGRVYEYRIVEAQTRRVVSAAGSLRSAAAGTGPFSFVFSADINENYQPYTLFTHMAERSPDFFLLLGDTAYTDYPSETFRPSLPYYRDKHARVRRDRLLQEFLSRHVTYATWDDHEVENNFHSGHPHLAEGLQAFRDYWPVRSTGVDALYRQFRWGGVDFFMLDTRRFRSPQSMADAPDKTMLGRAQKDWFKAALKASAAPFKFVITAVPFFGHTSDTWGNYGSERNELEWFIDQEVGGRVIFLTGDYHIARTQVSEVSGLHEYMAGPIGAFSLFERVPRRRELFRQQGGFVYGEGPNFGFWEVDAAAGVARLSYIDGRGQVLHRSELKAVGAG